MEDAVVTLLPRDDGAVPDAQFIVILARDYDDAALVLRVVEPRWEVRRCYAVAIDHNHYDSIMTMPRGEKVLLFIEHHMARSDVIDYMDYRDPAPQHQQLMTLIRRRRFLNLTVVMVLRDMIDMARDMRARWVGGETPHPLWYPTLLLTAHHRVDRIYLCPHLVESASLLYIPLPSEGYLMYRDAEEYEQDVCLVCEMRPHRRMYWVRVAGPWPSLLVERD